MNLWHGYGRMLAGLLALSLAALFAGAALYVSFVEHPARMLLEPEAALAQWQPSYKRGAVMQAGLAMTAFLAGLAAWWQTRDALFLAGAVFQILPWPWTLLVILPTNKALMALNPAQAGPESRALLEKWGRLHALRTGLGCAATLSFLLACLTLPAFAA
ncbi:MAG TPA: DUF1772 domain-containing protein [Rhizomicrobium sp.]|nr:DUF1772 domain-containing protein [Rhizomicrobium sp.]